MPDASRATIEAAARKAHAHAFIIEKLPDGYETLVGPGGSRLSGGQRQRIALARAILRNPEVLILDEATSQIDVESEQLIHNVLEEFTRNRTTFLITHRPSTIALADRVVVMDMGQIVDVGTPNELAGRCELYRRLCLSAYRESALAARSRRDSREPALLAASLDLRRGASMMVVVGRVGVRDSSWPTTQTPCTFNGTHTAHRSCPVVRAQPVRLPGAEPAVGRDFGRRESQPGQGLQFRLHLLPGRPHAAERDAVRRDRRSHGRAAGDARVGRVGGDLRDGEISRRAAALAAAQRHRLLRRRRADDVQEFRRAHGAVCGGEARRPGSTT